ncbi:Spo0B domain-containing protein [Desulfovirgula thermocuniculi]|uniref:Spo0B domain-containing protein n=1 Tax=Desulfovirgula thermocuniculi TaxID=348842 RepID=UPI00040F4CBE|nr:Spo0B domain-containing protein [Desulfovirgula thermocuniculi]
MEMADLLGVFRAQRHDFLNHLQVISGFIQLHKGEEARAYIREVARELERQGAILHLGVPEAAFALLYALREAALAQVDLRYDIRCSLVSCTVPGTRIGRALEAVLLRAVRMLSPPEVRHRSLSVSLEKDGSRCLFRVSVPVQDHGDLREAVDAAGEELAGCGGGAALGVRPAAGGLLAEVVLSLPLREGE